MAWPMEVVESYYRDLMKAKEEGRNLLFEKYAFMMEDTAPQEYAQLASYLPVISAGKQRIIKEITEVQTEWADEFRKKYPAYGGNGRPVYKYEARWGETSIETYVRGELFTYGEETIRLYAGFVKDCLQNGTNLTFVVRENMAILKGFSSVEEVEKSLRSIKNV